jgi:ankyrin repeat protein
LYIAAQNENVEVVSALMDASANIDQALTNRSTPWYISAQEGHATVVRALLEAGANVDHASMINRTLVCIRLKWQCGGGEGANGCRRKH